MRVAVIGAGPAGLLTGTALTRRGHEVVAVERDAGPPAEGPWERRGVMQFHHAHGFRPQVGDVLEREWPEAHDAWLGLGAEPIVFDVPGWGATVSISFRWKVHRSARRSFSCAPRSNSSYSAALRFQAWNVSDTWLARSPAPANASSMSHCTAGEKSCC